MKTWLATVNWKAVGVGALMGAVTTANVPEPVVAGLKALVAWLLG